MFAFNFKTCQEKYEESLSSKFRKILGTEREVTASYLLSETKAHKREAKTT